MFLDKYLYSDFLLPETLPVPIGEMINLYCYASSNPTNWVDPLGTDKLRRKFISDDIGFIDRLWAGWPSQFRKLDDLITKVKNEVGKPVDKTGKCGNCIKNLTIYSHSGRPGVIIFGKDGGGTSGLKTYEDKFKNLAQYLCDDGEIILRECSVGSGSEGTKSLKTLAAMVGVKITGATSNFRFGFDPAGWKTVTPDGKVTQKGQDIPGGTGWPKKKP